MTVQNVQVIRGALIISAIAAAVGFGLLIPSRISSQENAAGELSIPDRTKYDPQAREQLAKLGKARRDAAEKAFKGWWKDLFSGNGTAVNEQPFGVTYDLSVRWLHAELDTSSKNEERITAHAKHLQRMKDWAEDWKTRPESNGDLIAHAALKEAEFWLAKERSGMR